MFRPCFHKFHFDSIIVLVKRVINIWKYRTLNIKLDHSIIQFHHFVVYLECYISVLSQLMSELTILQLYALKLDSVDHHCHQETDHQMHLDANPCTDLPGMKI